MLYMDYIKKAEELVLEQHDNGIWYLVPEWHYILVTNKMDITKFRDYKADWNIVKDNLKLEVEKRNSTNNKLKHIADWIDDIISTQVDPVMLEEENELVSNALAYLKMNHEGK